MTRKKPTGLHWINSDRSRRVGQMFLEFSEVADSQNVTGGIAIAISEGDHIPLIAVEGRMLARKKEAAGFLLQAALMILEEPDGI